MRKFIKNSCIFLLVISACISFFTKVDGYENASKTWNIKLVIQDLPSQSKFCGRYDSKKLFIAGWRKGPKMDSWDEVLQGELETWDINYDVYDTKYAFFDSSNEAQYGMECSVPYMLGIEADPVSYQNSQSFSGKVFGDLTRSWEKDIERREGRWQGQGDDEIVAISFSKGRYACSLLAHSETRGKLNKEFLEGLAIKVEKKIDVATSLDNFTTQLPQLVTQQGILRSLQAKLDVVTKNYRKGEYKTALNGINAFINELDAQHGKHVSETAYQTLKGYADTIVQSLNALI